MRDFTKFKLIIVAIALSSIIFSNIYMIWKRLNGSNRQEFVFWSPFRLKEYLLTSTLVASKLGNFEAIISAQENTSNSWGSKPSTPKPVTLGLLSAFLIPAAVLYLAERVTFWSLVWAEIPEKSTSSVKLASVEIL